ncbi:ParB/RepB/Spo0J family partition protein [Streptomyces sp. col6]|uniref:ParB/RepB/Spo0J family partition protein n=1 Tax=Streptomyces sp. col6 TaxID=2478958 RepID=UPI0011CE1699|nr:ParB/RepB/Spo0J family partition protein [Streptomyces sp. col6]TXR94503.1 ParB/RepB/Spo0J family partition protein [Streptomyces sp. col6]
MKAADRLGTGSSFNKVPRGRSDRGRAKAVVEGEVPSYELVRLRLSEVTPTPLNPRRNFGTDEQKARFGEELRAVQLAACVAVSRDAYLALWPEHADYVGKADYVLVNGERRYRSADHVGLEALDFVVRNDLASSREDFVDFLLKENLDREDFDLVERARGVQALVEVCAGEGDAGAQTRAAERLGKSKAWVTNQLALLTLPEGIQERLSAGELPERDGRLLARHFKSQPELSTDDLLKHLASHREAQAQKRDEEKELLRAAKSGSVLTAVNTEAVGVGPANQPDVLTAVNTSGPVAGDTKPGGGTPGVLTAVNTPTPPAPELKSSASPGIVASEPTSTSSVPSQGRAAKPSGETEEYAQVLMKELGETPAAQAASIASALSTAELTALIEALRAHI